MSFSVTILGNSSAKPTLNAHPSAQVVNLNEQYYLIDAGEGVQHQLIRRGINPLRLRAIFISHLHGDHCFGLIPLLATLGLEGKRTPIDIYAPAPMGDILEFNRKIFLEDLPYEIKWHELRTTEHQIIMENNTLEVWSIPLRHRVPTAGFHFKEKQPQRNVDKFKIERYGLSIEQIVAAKRGEDIELESGEIIANEQITYIPHKARSYAYLSDTNYSAKAAERVKGVDLLYHEATYSQKDEMWASGRGHSTTTEAAKVALKAEAKRLIIGHFSARYRDYEALVEECRTIFANSDVAYEGATFTIEKEQSQR
jgi:ribonuclease Z